MDNYVIRMAEPHDAEVIAFHRAGMFFDMGLIKESAMDSLITASVVYFREAIEKKEYFGWLAVIKDKIVAGGGLAIRQVPPFPGNLEVSEGAYIFNMYTEPLHRRKGLARALMNAMLKWCHEHAISTVTLQASNEGRPLYESLGFEATNEMRLKK